MGEEESVVLYSKPWVTKVQEGSPAAVAGIQPIEVLPNGTVAYGDAVVSIGGNNLSNFQELQAELDTRRDGEEVVVTLENILGERRVVYVKLGARPSTP